MSVREPIIDERSPHYWLGYLVGTMKGVISGIENGRPAQAAADLKRALREYEMSPAARPGAWIVAYALEDATGECYAIRDSRVKIEDARARHRRLRRHVRPGGDREDRGRDVQPGRVAAEQDRRQGVGDARPRLGVPGRRGDAGQPRGREYLGDRLTGRRNR
jgi:hypothetical protein